VRLAALVFNQVIMMTPARPADVPAYSLGRPVNWWITAIPGR
jgi:hypothetical protein